MYKESTTADVNQNQIVPGTLTVPEVQQPKIVWPPQEIHPANTRYEYYPNVPAADYNPITGTWGYTGYIPQEGKQRIFESGATRDDSEGKLEYSECYNPLVLERYAQYMLEHSIASDGTKRPGNNWQKGIPKKEYVASLLRHVWDVWKLSMGYKAVDTKTGKEITIENALCAVLFNAQGYLFEEIKSRIT